MQHRLALLPAVLMLCAAASGLRAAEAVPAQPVVLASAACPDLARTRVRYAQCLWSRIWALPAFAPLRASSDQQMAALAQQIGVDPNLLIADVASAEGVVTVAAPFADPAPAARLRFPATIAAVMRALAARPGAVAGADGLVTLGEAAWHRDGEWLVVGRAGEALAAPPRVQPIEVDSDVSGVVDLAALTRLAPADPARKGDPQRALATLGLSTLRFHLSFVPEGTRELIEYPGLLLPLAPLDPAALASLPENPLLVYAAGLDGAKLATMVQDLVAASGEPDGLAEVDGKLAAFNLPKLVAILGGLRGTAWLAVANGAPFPTVTVAFPATPGIDACVQALATAQGVDLAAARTEAVPLPLPERVPVLVAVRRTATHWVVSSDAAQLERLGAGQAGGYALPAAAPGDLPTLGLGTLDLHGLGQLLLSYLPLIMNAQLAALPPEQQKEQRKVLVALQQGIAAALPLLTPSTAVLTQPPLGATVIARNAYVTVPFLAGMMLPAIGMVREKANQQKSAKNLQQIAGACIAYETQEDKPAPDLVTLAKAMDLPKALFRDPGAPAIAAPYLYVRASEPDAQQPFVLQDPACAKGKGCMVCFGDAHTRFIKAPAAQRLWAEAQRLAASPKAAAAGITLEDWVAVYDVLGVDPKDLPAPAGKPEASPVP